MGHLNGEVQEAVGYTSLDLRRRDEGQKQRFGSDQHIGSIQTMEVDEKWQEEASTH